MPNPTVNSLVSDGIAACRAGDKVRAFDLLVQALHADARNETAWLWLSAAVNTKGEQRFCLERVLELNPQNVAVRQGLLGLSQVEPVAPFSLGGVALKATAPAPQPVARPVPAPQAPPQPTARPAAAPQPTPRPAAAPQAAPQPAPRPAPQAALAMPRCSHPGCTATISRPGHTLCYEHWKASKAAPQPQPTGPMLNVSTIGERLGISARQVNQMFAELGWIEREEDGWSPTERGLALGAIRRVYPKSGTVFTIWPESIMEHKAVQGALQASNAAQEPASEAASFRERFPATFRTTDGHMVRSKAEVLIDNWLYMSGIVHAYERQLPIEEDAYCDFYIPEGKIYIEYWGLEDDPAYQERRAKKVQLYQRYNFNLLELNDEHVRNLDDVMPKLLLKFGVSVD
jgi:hypothetical protein